MSTPGRRRWLVVQEGERRRWGGDLRRAFIFRELAARTGATVAEGWSPATVRKALGAAAGPRRPPLFRRNRPLVASCELLAPALVAGLGRGAVPFVLDVHDDPVAQYAAFGVDAVESRLAELRELMASNLAAFAYYVAPSASFAELAGLDPDRTILASNGTDTRHVVPGPPPSAPTVGFISGAAQGRGIETLVSAARILRDRVPELQLRLWLVASGDLGEAYLGGLATTVSGDDWIRIQAAPYERLGSELTQASVMCIPHPPGAYLDSALPVKLFDSMAAGRPLVVTPRLETRRVVERTDAGIVTAGDRPEDLADALAIVLDDAELARRLGANGRAAAEREFDWRIIGSTVADRVLALAGN